MLGSFLEFKSQNLSPSERGTQRKLHLNSTSPGLEIYSGQSGDPFPVDYRLVVVGELACLSDLESYTVGGIPPAGPTLAGRSKGRG